MTRADRLRDDIVRARIAGRVTVTESEWDESMDVSLGEIPPETWRLLHPLLLALRRVAHLESADEGLRVMVGDLTLRVLISRPPGARVRTR